MSGYSAICTCRHTEIRLYHPSRSSSRLYSNWYRSNGSLFKLLRIRCVSRFNIQSQDSVSRSACFVAASSIVTLSQISIESLESNKTLSHILTGSSETLECQSTIEMLMGKAYIYTMCKEGRVPTISSDVRDQAMEKEKGDSVNGKTRETILSLLFHWKPERKENSTQKGNTGGTRATGVKAA